MPFDLEKRYGRGYHIERDEHGPYIPAVSGRIRRHDDKRLLVEGAPPEIVAALKLLWRAAAHEREGEIVVVVPVGQFGQVARIVRPQRRRRMATAEQRQEAARRLAPFQFRPLQPVDGHGPKDH